ncbi:MAG: hypothetical protein GC199_00090 [Alphaproteobacteria bacterium]|nr:hypothetical protein [Alphaproteobacteria bacterium]
MPSQATRILTTHAGGLPPHEHEVGLFTESILPTDMTLVAGVIDPTSNSVEHPELVATRIERTVQAIGDVKQFMAGTDCGFATSAGHVMIPDDVV